MMPYLIVATPVWQAHGPFSDSTYADLKKSVTILVEKVTTPSGKNSS